MGVYEDLGIRPLINAWGTVTAVGGSLMAPEVLEAMREASTAFVDLHELHRRAGESIAADLGVAAACVTSGAAAGLTIAAAACMTLGASGRRLQLPDTTGLPDECLIGSRHRNRYDRAVSVSGARLVELPASPAATIDDVRRAVTARTAMFLYLAESESLPGLPSLSAVAAVMKESGVPVVVDAAAEVPPRTNLARYLDGGADLLILSGGKEIRGPQSSGLILGSADLIAECAAHSFPNHGIGRGMKTDKETIAGLVKAVGLFARRDERAQLESWGSMVDGIVTSLNGHPRMRARRHIPSAPGIQPTIVPRVYVRPTHRTAEEVAATLRDGDPAIVVGLDDGELAINPQCLAPEQIPILVRAIEKAC